MPDLTFKDRPVNAERVTILLTVDAYQLRDEDSDGTVDLAKLRWCIEDALHYRAGYHDDSECDDIIELEVQGFEVDSEAPIPPEALWPTDMLANIAEGRQGEIEG